MDMQHAVQRGNKNKCTQRSDKTQKDKKRERKEKLLKVYQMIIGQVFESHVLDRAIYTMLKIFNDIFCNNFNVF